MTNDIKYSYRNKNGIVFRIKLERSYDFYFGVKISYTIQENAPIPKNRWQKLKQFFTVKNYSSGHWYSAISTGTLDDLIEAGMEFVIHSQEKEKEAEQTWANLK